METTENIIAIVNGLQSTRYNLLGKCGQFRYNAAQKQIMEAQAAMIERQIDELTAGQLYQSVKAELRKINLPYAKALQSTKGMNGQQILIALSKQSA